MTKKTHPLVIDLTEQDDAKRCRKKESMATLHPPREVAALPRVVERIEAVANSLEERFRDAASTGKPATLKMLLKEFKGDLRPAVVAAASHGHLKCLQALAQPFKDPDGEQCLNFDGQQLIQNGLGPAAANVHYQVVDFLWFASRNWGIDPDGSMSEAFIQAVANGHVDIVKLIAGDTTWGKKEARRLRDAISKAIGAEFEDVVRFLITWEKFPGDVDNLLEEAIAKEKHEIVKKSWAASSAELRGDIFTELASEGRLQSLKYMFEHGHYDPELLQAALRYARGSKHVDVEQFLFTTG